LLACEIEQMLLSRKQFNGREVCQVSTKSEAPSASPS
jgi:hypothetical protein